MNMPVAVVLAGGLGSRLRPLTEVLPKPALPVAGTPLLGLQLAWLAGHGVHEAVIASGYAGDALAAAVGDGSAYGVRVSFVREPAPLGTGGALARALRTLPTPPERVIVTNGDQLTGHDLGAQVVASERSGASVCVHARNVLDARPFGLLTLEGEQVVAFREKPPAPVPGLVNAGTYVVRPSALTDVPDDREVSLEREVFPALLARGDLVTAYAEDAYCLDVGTPVALRQATADRIAAGAPAVDPSARVARSAVVGGGSWVGPEAVVEADVRLTGTVVLPGARVGAGCALVDCVVQFGAAIAAGTRASGAVLT
ncbi:NDP-sugar synthase [Calidifontibacter sp. DB0510]|uniref:NDP-sugar synthase n=1 Tax=Metallococcus carri TaxID=1656884 RepID=A0A967EGE2_9MICO|nr:NDP-sugar synthase [Metallococcus carri]NHN54963.1 NDP-sugar synthase [Metallococcus carri]NOP37309.1 NDP-sugar synthase [Calidifontibacter sp. DB2511S]